VILSFPALLAFSEAFRFLPVPFCLQTSEPFPFAPVLTVQTDS
jgi:hypothetical protein